MKNNLLLEKHKLAYHPETLTKFYNEEIFPPINVEIAPTARCNQKCVMCYTDYVMNSDYSPNRMQDGLIFKVIKDCADFGVKSIVLSGTGESLLHPEVPKAISYAKSLGLEISLVSNGVLGTKEKIGNCLGDLTWIRFSMSGGTPETYAINQYQSDKIIYHKYFHQVIKNLTDLAEIKKIKDLKTTIGVAYFLFPNCSNEIFDFVKIIKETGIDYIQIKPCGDFKKNSYVYDKTTYKNKIQQLNKAANLSDDTFYCQIKEEGFDRLSDIDDKGGWENLNDDDATYFLPAKCWGLKFLAYVGADGNVYTCAGSWYEEKDCYGSLKNNTLEEIWESERFKQVFSKRSKTAHELCFTQCHNISMNKYLMDLKDSDGKIVTPSNPPDHINFI